MTWRAGRQKLAMVPLLVGLVPLLVGLLTRPGLERVMDFARQG
jgi:hypothetical protein